MDPMTTDRWLIVLCGLVVFAGGILAGCMVGPWRLIHWAHMRKLDDYADRDYEEGWHDGASEMRDVRRLESAREARGTDLRPMQGSPARLSAPVPSEDSQDLCEGSWLAGEGRPLNWRAEMTEQLAPAALDAANLPGPAVHALSGEQVRPAGEHHRRAIVDLGQPGDDKMLTRDWFNRRAFIESLSNKWGGFEITEHGHLVAIAA
jgi:hypothetical protein